MSARYTRLPPTSWLDLTGAAAQVLDMAGKMVAPGVTTDEIDKAVHKMIIEVKAAPAWARAAAVAPEACACLVWQALQQVVPCSLGESNHSVMSRRLPSPAAWHVHKRHERVQTAGLCLERGRIGGMAGLGQAASLSPPGAPPPGLAGGRLPLAPQLWPLPEVGVHQRE